MHVADCRNEGSDNLLLDSSTGSGLDVDSGIPLLAVAGVFLVELMIDDVDDRADSDGLPPFLRHAAGRERDRCWRMRVMRRGITAEPYPRMYALTIGRRMGGMMSMGEEATLRGSRALRWTLLSSLPLSASAEAIAARAGLDECIELFGRAASLTSTYSSHG